MGWANWRAARAARPEFVKTSQARIWRIVTLAVISIVGATFAVVAFAVIVSRLSRDEQCLKSVVAAQSERSSVLTRLAAKRTAADSRARFWDAKEKEAFKDALNAVPQKTVRREFIVANRHYLAAYAQWRRLDTAYNRASQAHPVPQLRCSAGALDRPVPVVTWTVTAAAPRPSTVVRTSRVPGPVRTVHVPGPVRTVTVAPGHRKHGGKK